MTARRRGVRWQTSRDALGHLSAAQHCGAGASDARVGTLHAWQYQHIVPNTSCSEAAVARDECIAPQYRGRCRKLKNCLLSSLGTQALFTDL